MIGLLDLPTELVVEVFCYLCNDDISSARLCCKQVEKRSFEHFASVFFRKNGYMITSLSIEKLEAISCHHQLRQYVQHVWFNPDCFTWAKPQFDEGRINEDGDYTISSKYHNFQDCVRDHRNLLHSSLLETHLAKAFAGFPNLEAVGMRRGPEHSSWGWREIMRRVGHDPRQIGRPPRGPVRALSESTLTFVAILRALAKSGSRIEELYTDAIEIDSIAETNLPQEVLSASLHSLRYLDLCACKAWLESELPSDICMECIPGQGLKRVLTAASGLEHLGLSFLPDIPLRPYRPHGRAPSYAQLAFASVAQEIGNHAFVSLELEGVSATEDNLRMAFQGTGSTLRRLKLRSVHLLNSEAEFRWPSILNFIRDTCSALKAIHLCYFQERGKAVVLQSNLDHDPCKRSYRTTPTILLGKESVREGLTQLVQQCAYATPEDVDTDSAPDLQDESRFDEYGWDN